MNSGIEQGRQEVLLNPPDRDNFVDPVSRPIGRNRFGWKSRIALAGTTFLVAAAGLFAPSLPTQLLSQALSNLRNPEKAGKAGEFTTSNLLINTVNAAVNNRVLMPFAPWDGTPTPTATPTPTLVPPVQTPESIPTRTPTPTATETPTPAPFELRMNVDSGVSVTDAGYVREGVEASRSFMQRHFNFNMDGIVTVNLRNDTTIPHASYRVIEIGASQQEFSTSQPMGKRNTATHETGHQLQYFLTNNLESGLWGDWFLQEGTAQYIADKGLTEAGYYPNNQKEACSVYTVVRIPDSRSLRQINSSNPNMPVWAVASLAIQDMVETYGDGSLSTYWRSVNANGPETAFRTATGVSLDQFAAQFDVKRRQFTFPGTKYQAWANQDPCAGI